MSPGSPSSDSSTTTKKKKEEESQTISSLLFEGQLLHVGLLLMSTFLTIYNIHKNNNSSQIYEDENSSSESGHSSQEEYQWIVPTTTTTSICYWILCFRVLHHILITVIWRTELYCSDLKLSKFVQSKQVALQITECIDVSYFAVAGNGMLMLAYYDYESSQQLPSSKENEYYYYIRIFVGLICVLVGSWAIGSAIVYLGPKQLAGYDHFYLPPPPSSSSSSLSSSSVSKENNKRKLIQSGGAYTYVDHPIYYFGIFVDWGIAILAASQLCLWMALSAHISALAFLWGTELPDLKYIYYGEDEHNTNNTNNGNNGNVDKVE